MILRNFQLVVSSLFMVGLKAGAFARRPCPRVAANPAMALVTRDTSPLPIRDLLRRYEFANEVDRALVSHGEIYNLAIGEVEYTACTLRGRLLRDVFLMEADFGSTTKRPKEVQLTSTWISLHMNDHDFLQGAKEVFALGIRPCPNQEKMRADVVHFQTDPQTLILPSPEATSFNGSINVELFAGGYGGWSWARRQLERLGVPKLRTVSIEIDLQTALQHAVNHPEHLFPPKSSTPMDLLQKLPGDCMFVQGVEDIHWKRSVGTSKHEYWTVSASCQSWSAAGLEQGVSDARGMTLLEAIAAARIFRPKALLVEQVKGFRYHKDYPYFLSMIHWAGYDCWHEEVNELSEICPIRRPRFLAIYIRNHADWSKLPAYEKWGSFPTMYPLEFGSWLQSTEQEMQEFTPSQQIKEFYMHPEMFPQKKGGEVSTHKVFQTRVPGVNRIQPVAMAMYGQQHNLDLRALLDKGLHGFFCQEKGDFRWFKPTELALLHLQTDSIVLFKPATKAWKSLGNMIAMPHALVLLLNLWKALGVLPQNLSIHKVFLHVRSQRMQAEKIEIKETAEAWLMANLGEMQNLMQRHEFFSELLGPTKVFDFQWPPDQFVHMQQGPQPLSMLFQPRRIPKQAEDLSQSAVLQEESNQHKRKHRQETEEAQIGAILHTVAVQKEHEPMLTPDAATSPEVMRNMSNSDLLAESQTRVTPFFLPGEYGFVQLHETVHPSHVRDLWHHPVVLAKCHHTGQVLTSDVAL